jgi:hypothetical protein
MRQQRRGIGVVWAMESRQRMGRLPAQQRNVISDRSGQRTALQQEKLLLIDDDAFRVRIDKP